MTTVFIDAFRRMHVHEREQALKALTAELSPYEWRALHATTSSRTFQFDVIGNLPVELVAQVFSHVDVATPYRLQSVSRRWNNTLKSLHVLKASLNQWYQGTVDFQDADYALCQKKACKINAFRTGKPRKVYKITPKDEIKDMYLAGNNLIWQNPFTAGPEALEHQSRSVCILDLAAWDLRYIGGEGRERIIDIFVSSEIVALTTWANICYVHELHGKRGCRTFRVPNAFYFSNVACRGRTVACVSVNKHRAAVYIWQYDSQRGMSFEIKNEPGTIFWKTDALSHPIAPIVQPATRTIIIFTSYMHNTEVPPHQRHFAFSRYTYSGECLGTHHASLPEINPISYWYTLNTFVPVDYEENILSILMRDGDGVIDTRKSSFLVRFNEGEMDMSVWEGSRLYGHVESTYTGGSIAWWNDTCYAALWDGKAEKRDMIALMGANDGRVYRPIISESTDTELPQDWDKMNAPVVLNENYVIRNALDRFYILCFDDDDESKWPKESGPFFDIGELEVLKGMDT